MAGASGLPVRLSQTTVVSRWLVKPSALMSLANSLADAIACCTTVICVVQISMASCSTQPECGVLIWVSR
ncbi:hypothetical protein D3C75_805390 [compost metagenome]